MTQRQKHKDRVAVLALAAMLCPGMAQAHASDQGFVLLLPTDFYITSGTAAVAASILLVTFLAPRLLGRVFTPVTLGQGWQAVRPVQITSCLSTAVFFALIVSGFTGPNDPLSNPLPLAIWTLWWVGLFVVQGVVADVWRWINPWRGIHALLAHDIPPLMHLPERWGAWPAVALFMAFQVFVLADIAPSDPERLALFAAAYWALTFVGMILFGGEAWLARVECFTVLFRLVGSLRAVHLTGPAQIGMPGWASLHRPLIPGEAVFCLVILGSGSFDGLHETFWWLGQIGINPLEFPGRSAVVVQSVLGLIASNLALIAVFALAIWLGLALVRRLGQDGCPKFGHAFDAFAITILPIALGYHFAHYLVSFMVQIQYVAVALNDPLARGWTLLGSEAPRVTTGFLNTTESVRRIWLTQGIAVVASHILSVLMAHHLAGQMSEGRRDVVLLQVGLAALMIAYTIFGLWLLAAPRGV